MARLEKLKELEDKLYTEMQMASSKEIAAIAKQYRETLKEIEELEGQNVEEDEIEKLLKGERVWCSGAKVQDSSEV